MNPHPERLWATVDGSRPPACTSLLGGVGVVLCDPYGELLTLTRPVSPALHFTYIERLAVLVALEIAWQIGARSVIVHTDCLDSVRQILKERRADNGLGEITERVRRQMRRFANAEIRWIEREENERAHNLAREGTHYGWERVWVRGDGARQ